VHEQFCWGSPARGHGRSELPTYRQAPAEGKRATRSLLRTQRLAQSRPARSAFARRAFGTGTTRSRFPAACSRIIFIRGTSRPFPLPPAGPAGLTRRSPSAKTSGTVACRAFGTDAGSGVIVPGPCGAHARIHDRATAPAFHHGSLVCPRVTEAGSYDPRSESKLFRPGYRRSSLWDGARSSESGQ